MKHDFVGIPNHVSFIWLRRTSLLIEYHLTSTNLSSPEWHLPSSFNRDRLFGCFRFLMVTKYVKVFFVWTWGSRLKDESYDIWWGNPSHDTNTNRMTNPWYDLYHVSRLSSYEGFDLRVTVETFRQIVWENPSHDTKTHMIQNPSYDLYHVCCLDLRPQLGRIDILGFTLFQHSVVVRVIVVSLTGETLLQEFCTVHLRTRRRMTCSTEKGKGGKS